MSTMDSRKQEKVIVASNNGVIAYLTDSNIARLVKFGLVEKKEKKSTKKEYS